MRRDAGRSKKKGLSRLLNHLILLAPPAGIGPAANGLESPRITKKGLGLNASFLSIFALFKNNNGLQKKFKYSTKCADNRDNLISILCRDDGNSPVSGYLFQDGH